MHPRALLVVLLPVTLHVTACHRCPAGQEADGADCFTPCNSHEDCARNQDCVEGRCTPGQLDAGVVDSSSSSPGGTSSSAASRGSSASSSSFSTASSAAAASSSTAGSSASPPSSSGNASSAAPASSRSTASSIASWSSSSTGSSYAASSSSPASSAGTASSAAPSSSSSPSGCGGTVPPDAWWNTAWCNRLPLRVTTVAAVPAEYTLDVVLDHAALVARGVSRADGEDVRVVALLNGAWLELDRVLDAGSAWGLVDTRLRFRTRAIIGGMQSDTRYALYFGNALPGAAPQDAGKVFLFQDGFEDGALARWTPVEANNVYTASSVRARTGTYAASARSVGMVNRFLVAAAPPIVDMEMDAWWFLENPLDADVTQAVRATTAAPMTELEVNLDMGPGTLELARTTAGAWTLVSRTSQPAFPPSRWTRITLQAVGTRMRLLQDGVERYAWTESGAAVRSGTVALRAYNLPNNRAWLVDDVTVRPLVDPEPATSMAGEEVLR